MDTQRLLTSAETAAREAGEILLRMQSQVSPREKAPADLVTEADLAAQHAIEARLGAEFPDFYFIGEEGPSAEARGLQPPAGGFGWVVDPLDGTTNYVHGLDNFCVSIALRHRDQIVLGVIYDPIRDQLFRAAQSQGAELNGGRLQVSDATGLERALVAASFPARVPPEAPEVKRFLEILHRARAVRRLGSAALNLAYVAAGKLDAYWATSVRLWDVAAGFRCVQEAGGTLTALDGGPLNLDDPRFLATATQSLHEEMLQVLNAAAAADA